MLVVFLVDVSGDPHVPSPFDSVEQVLAHPDDAILRRQTIARLKNFIRRFPRTSHPEQVAYAFWAFGRIHAVEELDYLVPQLDLRLHYASGASPDQKWPVVYALRLLGGAAERAILDYIARNNVTDQYLDCAAKLLTWVTIDDYLDEVRSEGARRRIQKLLNR